MDTVEVFLKSDDIAWDVSEENIEELIPSVNISPDVVLVVSGYTMMIYKKEYVKVKVVNEKSNGDASEVE